MCNTLHTEHAEIPKKGRGWKVFYQMSDGRYNKCFDGHERYQRNRGTQWAEWKFQDLDIKQRGFCFYVDKQTAEDFVYDSKLTAFGAHKKIVIKEIEYEGGLGKHTENAMGAFCRSVNDSYEYYLPTIALCKRFRILRKKKEQEND